MGLFDKAFDKIFNVEASLVSILTTFGQAIEACEKGNDLKLNEIWDIFINTAGYLADGGLISETALDVLVERSNFPHNHTLTLDLIKIRNSTDSIQNFVEGNKRNLEIVWSPNGLGVVQELTPEFFAERLKSLAQDFYPNFGKSQLDEAFIAVLAIFVLTVILDSEQDSRSNRTSRRISAYEFALRWLSEWNHA
jgi:hypothetical protein